MDFDRRRLLAGLAAATPLSLWGPAHAQGAWPERTVRIVSPYGAGGSNDISARLFAERFGKRMGQQFNVENKPGAGTRLANEFVARAPADGTTLLYAAAPFAVVESLYGKLSYDPGRDFQPVTLALVAPVFLIVNAELPVKTVAEFIKYAKSKPQGINIGSPAPLGPALTGELFMKEAGIQGLSVHFRDDAPPTPNCWPGAWTRPSPPSPPRCRTSRPASCASSRWPETTQPIEPQVPTFAEAGFPNIVGYGWFGFIVPRGTPAAVVDKLSAETNAVLAEPDFKARMLQLGLQPRGGTPAEFAAFIVRETRKWSDVIRVAGVKGE